MREEKMMEFAESVPMDELFEYLRKITGLPDLKFTYKVEENRMGEPIIRFSSQDLVDKVGFLKLMFSEIHIGEFNSQIAYDKDNEQYYYWGTADFSYNHPSGGSNGCRFCSFWYKNGSWTFDDR